MNELTVRQENAVAISVETEELIRAGVSENTLKAYRRRSKSWRRGWWSRRLV